MGKRIFLPLLFLVFSLISLSCARGEYGFYNVNLLYAEIMNPTMSNKSDTNVMLKIPGNQVIFSGIYKFNLTSTHRSNVPIITVEFKFNKSNERYEIKYLEVDLPDLQTLIEWKKAFEENKPLILYPKTPA